jgi:cell division protein FtsL
MATWATAATAPPPVPKAKPPISRLRAARQTAPRRRVIGVVWIAMLALLLAGVVAMNVAVLRLNMTLERLGHKRAELRATNADLALRLSSAAAAPRIEAIAAKRLALVQTPPEQTTYLRLDP